MEKLYGLTCIKSEGGVIINLSYSHKHEKLAHSVPTDNGWTICDKHWENMPKDGGYPMYFIREMNFII